MNTSIPTVHPVVPLQPLYFDFRPHLQNHFHNSLNSPGTTPPSNPTTSQRGVAPGLNTNPRHGPVGRCRRGIGAVLHASSHTLTAFASELWAIQDTPCEYNPVTREIEVEYRWVARSSARYRFSFDGGFGFSIWDPSSGREFVLLPIACRSCANLLNDRQSEFLIALVAQLAAHLMMWAFSRLFVS